MIIDDVLPVMVDDALLSSHPIIVNVSTPAEITSVFDSISYSKVGQDQGQDQALAQLPPLNNHQILFRERPS